MAHDADVLAAAACGDWGDPGDPLAGQHGPLEDGHGLLPFAHPTI
ncbi:hypothetical protein [Pseudanabaena sp. FACHB-2040]|nr:hypothetical protein [Pseudanabaena sp. FACHB-2040]